MLDTKKISERKNISPNRSMYIHSAIGIAFMLGFPLLDPIGPITPVGMHVLAIFLGMVYMWSTVNSIWPSLLGLFLIAMSGYAPIKTVAIEAFGADVVVLVTLSMVLFAGIEHAG